MKKIDFGWSNDLNPNGSLEGVGLKKGFFLSEADYYGSFEFENNFYVVAKVAEDYGRYPELLNKFIVRQALCDVYPDGSSILYLNQGETQTTQKLEDRLNNPQINDNIANIEDVMSEIKAYPSSYLFMLKEMTSGDMIVSASILPEVFERKNSAIKSCHSTFSEMQQQLDSIYKKNNELNSMLNDKTDDNQDFYFKKM